MVKLDMYINRETYLLNNQKDKINLESFKQINIQPKRVKLIIEEVAYWCSNFPLNHFITENFSYDEFHQEKIYLTEDNIQSIIETVKVVLNNPTLAPKLFPNIVNDEEGNYDKFYFEEIKETKEVFEKLLKEDNTHSTFYYHSRY